MNSHAKFEGVFGSEVRRWTRFVLAATLTVASTTLTISSATAQDTIRIRPAASTARPAVDGDTLSVRQARLPIFVDVDLDNDGGLPRIPADAVGRVAATLDANPRRLVTLRLRNAALQFADLGRPTRNALFEQRGPAVIGAYDDFMANQVLRFVDGIRAARPRAALAIQGLPFEGGRVEATAGNRAYAPVLERMSAIVVGGGMMTSAGVDQGGMLARAYPNAMAVADGRAVLFAANAGWRIATVVPRPAAEPVSVLADASENDERPPADDPAEVLTSPIAGDFPSRGDRGDQGGDEGIAGIGLALDAAPGRAGGGGGSGGFGGGGGGRPTGAPGVGGTGLDAEDSTEDDASPGDSDGIESDDADSDDAGGTGSDDLDSDDAGGAESGDAGGDDAGGTGSDDLDSDDAGGAESGDAGGDDAGGTGSDDADSDDAGGTGSDDAGDDDADDIEDGDGEDWNPEDEVVEDDRDDAPGDAGDAGESGSSDDAGQGGDGPGDGDAGDGDDWEDDDWGDDWGDDDTGGDGHGEDGSDHSSAPVVRFGGDPDWEAPPVVNTGFEGELGHGHEPIARFDVVPFRPVESGFTAGLLAFHSGGVDRVEFALEGGPSVAVLEPTVNPRTGVREYWVELDLSDAQAGGSATLRATVYPTVGRSRSLDVPLAVKAPAESLQTWVDPQGSDDFGDGSPANPYRTISRGIEAVGDESPGLARTRVVNLAPGAYEWRSQATWHRAETDDWITVRPDSGVARDQVVIEGTDSGGPRAAAVHFEDVTIVNTIRPTGADRLWIEGGHLRGVGSTTPFFWFTGAWGDVYVTDSLATDVTNAFQAPVLARGCLVDGVAQDAFPGGLLVADCEVRGQVPGVTASGHPMHSDIWQSREGVTDRDVILCGLVAVENCIGQGIMTRVQSHVNFAISDCRMNTEGFPARYNLNSGFTNLVIERSAFLGTPVSMSYSDTLDGDNFGESESMLVETSLFQWLVQKDSLGEWADRLPIYYVSPSDGGVFRGNHYLNEWPAYTGSVGVPHSVVDLGVDYTTGPQVAGGVGPRAWID